MEQQADLMMHPVRMRIVQTLIGGRQLTVQDMSTHLNDVPPATLYRHLKKLVEGGVIQVIARRQIRGTFEKIYALEMIGGNLNDEWFQKSTKEEQKGYFIQYISGLIDCYGKYIDKNSADPRKDGLAFHTETAYMSDKEYQDFIQALAETVKEFTNKEPAQNRHKRVISAIIIPEHE